MSAEKKVELILSVKDEYGLAPGLRFSFRTLPEVSVVSANTTL